MTIIRNDALPEVEIKVSECCGEYACRSHSHREYSLGIIHEGITRDSIPGKEISLEKNDTILFPPELVHLCRPDADRPFAFTMIYMERNWFERALIGTSASAEPSRGRITQEQESVLDHLKEGLCQLETDLRNWEEEFIQCIAGLLQLQDRDGSSAAEPELTALTEKIRKELDGTPAEQRSLEEMAAEAGISRYSLIRRFKKAYGLPPHAYLQNRRIRYCQSALKQGREMSAVALEAGFTDQSHMIRTFRLYTGMTPGEYIRENVGDGT